MDDLERGLEPIEPVREETSPADDAAAEEQFECDERDACEDCDECEQFELSEDYIPAQKKKPIKGPSAWAWVAAVLTVGICAMALLLAGFNGTMGLHALTGLACEALGQNQSALSAYAMLGQAEQAAAAWGAENFAFGREEVPGFTTGDFLSERELRIFGKSKGPFFVYNYRQQGYFGGLDLDPMPKSLREIKQQVDTIDSIINLYYNLVEEQPQSPEESLAVLEAARAADENAEERTLYYDAIYLMMNSSGDLTSDEIGQRLAALRAAPGSQPWMYLDVQVERARKLEDYAQLAQLYEEQLALDTEETVYMQGRVRALYLAGKPEEAAAQADAYAKKSALLRPYMQLAKAELAYRGGKYDEAIVLCGKVYAEAAAAGNGSLAMEADAVKAVTLMLQGKADEAYTMLSAYLETLYEEPSREFQVALLCAAAAAGEKEFLGEITGGGQLPGQINDILEGKLTVKAFYTEGWGGITE